VVIAVPFCPADKQAWPEIRMEEQTGTSIQWELLLEEEYSQILPQSWKSE
jgi:hypothetical protein